MGGRFCCFFVQVSYLFPLSGSFQGIPPRLAKSSFQLTLNTRAIPLSYVGVERTTESVRHQQFLVSFSSFFKTKYKKEKNMRVPSGDNDRNSHGPERFSPHADQHQIFDEILVVPFFST